MGQIMVIFSIVMLSGGHTPRDETTDYDREDLMMITAQVYFSIVVSCLSCHRSLSSWWSSSPLIFLFGVDIHKGSPEIGSADLNSVSESQEEIHLSEAIVVAIYIQLMTITTASVLIINMILMLLMLLLSFCCLHVPPILPWLIEGAATPAPLM